MTTFEGGTLTGTRPILRRLGGRAGAVAAIGTALLLALPLQTASAVGQVDGLNANSADFDARTTVVAPTAAQVSRVNALGAQVEWSRFGTPHSLIKVDGSNLASNVSGATAVVAARAFIEANKSLFKLTSTADSALQAIADNPLVDTSAHAVLFRQKFGGVPAAQDGMITVGLASAGTSKWNVVYVSSTSAGSQAAPVAPSISAVDAWLAAAHAAGLPGSLGNVAKLHTDGDWTVFTVRGYPQLQRARLRALPIPGGGVRPVFETDVQKIEGATSLAFVSMVDAVSKKIWLRWNAVDADASNETMYTQPTTTEAAPVSSFFAGTTGAYPTCGPLVPLPTPAGTQSIAVVASANIPANDIVLKLLKNGTTIASSDEATSPEAVNYAPSGGVPVGVYTAQVCPFDAGLGPMAYTGFYVISDQAASAIPYPPEWKDFANSPKLDYSNTDNRIVDCWQHTSSASDCNREDLNPWSRAPWDVDPASGLPTYTSIGNNAKTAESWLSPLTPSENYSPPTTNRKYYFPFTNQWFTSKCNPTSFTSTAKNDIDASIINLFVGHNRMHDFSYGLGFREQTWNMQTSNFGNGAPGPYPGAEKDPELGNVQAGAVTGGNPSFEGRDNANQVTLQDGVPGITNQYLFQPIAGAFYAPCTDGSFDFTVFGHEYTHAISNRMVGGPDSGLSGNQAGAMGESWSDLDALEYLHEFSIPPAGNVNDWALGPYVTGNKQVGIRNFALNNNPLNYSDIGYDSACNSNLVGPPVEPTCSSISEVHADGEIWNAVNYSIRQALVAKWDKIGPWKSTDKALQLACGLGQRNAGTCPGNRRWIQLVYDAWLMMPPDVSMLGARDAMLAADAMRFKGADLKELWHQFAARGMGPGAHTNGTDDDNPIPGWASPKETNGNLVFNAVNELGQPVKATIYIGKFQARVTPAADTDSTTPLSNTIHVVPNRYWIIASAPGYGHLRFQTTATTATNTITLHFFTNWASSAKGGVASGDGGNFPDLIDDTEGTDWAYIGGASDTAVGKHVDVRFNSARFIQVVQVSAMLHQADDDDDYDNGGQNRFTALKSFEIWECLGSAANGQCAGSTGWVKTGTFNNAFPAGLPRPLMPDMLIKQFNVTVMKADHVRLVVKDNQCTGTAAYHGELDNDPANDTDCITASDMDTMVRVAELQAMAGKPYASGGTSTTTATTAGATTDSIAATDSTTTADAATTTHTTTDSSTTP